MKEQFVTYEIAKKLKELGFDEYCIGEYTKHANSGAINLRFPKYEGLQRDYPQEHEIIAPLWGQVFDWLRKKNIHFELHYFGGNKYQFKICPESKITIWVGDKQILYEQARELAILKALELISENKLKKGGNVKKHKMSGEKNTFKEIADWGDRKFFVRDFGHAVIEDENGDDKEIPLVLVAEIMDWYDATGEDQFEEKPFGIDISIYPAMEFIDKKHIESCADSAGIEPEEVQYYDLVSYGLGIPLLLKDLETLYKELEDAETFLLSKEMKNKLNAQSIMVGFFLDGAINKIGNSRWSMLEYAVNKEKDFYRQ